MRTLNWLIDSVLRSGLGSSYWVRFFEFGGNFKTIFFYFQILKLILRKHIAIVTQNDNRCWFSVVVDQRIIELVFESRAFEKGKCWFIFDILTFVRRLPEHWVNLMQPYRRVRVGKALGSILLFLEFLEIVFFGKLTILYTIHLESSLTFKT